MAVKVVAGQHVLVTVEEIAQHAQVVVMQSVEEVALRVVLGTVILHVILPVQQTVIALQQLN